MDPLIAHTLGWFGYQHLPEHLQSVSKPFSLLAADLAARHAGPDLQLALHYLLLAKDCAVRAAVCRHRTGQPPARAAGLFDGERGQ